MATRIAWNRVRPATLRAEAIELIGALLLIWIGWLTVPTLLLAMLMEPLAIVALSWRIHPWRGRRAHLFDILAITGLLFVLGAIILLDYAAAGGFRHGAFPLPRELLGAGLLVIVRCLLLLRDARRAPQPPLHWARHALMRGAALVVGSFLAIFTCLIPGVLLASLLAALWPTHAADIAIAATYLLTVGVVACILSTMDEQALARIANRPYLDG